MSASRIGGVGILAACLLASSSCRDERSKRTHHEVDDEETSPAALDPQRRDTADATRVCNRLFTAYGQEVDDKRLVECATDLAELREVSPTAYACMDGCLDKDRSEVGVCLLKCQEGDPKVAEHFRGKAERASSKSADDARRWPKLPEKTFDGSIEDSGGKTIRYEIKLVEGFAMDASLKTQLMRYYKLDTGSGGPSVSVAVPFVTDMDKVAATATTTGDKVVKKVATPLGFIVLTTTPRSLSAHVYVKSGDAQIECKANLLNEKASTLEADVLPWLEKLCASVSVTR